MSAHGSRPPGASWQGTCPTCGEPTITRHGKTTHTVAGRGDRWQGTLAELIDCAPGLDHPLTDSPDHERIQPMTQRDYTEGVKDEVLATFPQQYRVTVATTDGEVVETYTTAPIQPGRPIAVAREALKDAMFLNSLGDNEWVES